MYTLRPFAKNDSDYETLVAICNAYRPEEAVTVDLFQHQDKHQKDQFPFHRDLISYDGEIIAWGGYYQNETTYKANKFGFQFYGTP